MSSLGIISNAPIVEGEKQIYKYTYNPKTPTSVIGGYLLMNGGPIDNRPFINERLSKFNDIVYFESAIFEVSSLIG